MISVYCALAVALVSLNVLLYIYSKNLIIKKLILAIEASIALWYAIGLPSARYSIGGFEPRR